MPEYVIRATNLPTDPMVRAYLECAEWCGLEDTQREALELSVSPTWAPEAIHQATEDCAAFLEGSGEDIGDKEERAGHDFWLTRNRHGAGFWGGDWPADAGRRLTANARPYGECSVYFDSTTETLYLE
jgi:hypothetical protein